MALKHLSKLHPVIYRSCGMNSKIIAKCSAGLLLNKVDTENLDI